MRALLARDMFPDTPAIGPGHNRPPEPLDVPSELRSACAEISQSLAAAEHVLSEPAPSSSVLFRIGQSLGDASLTVMRYCGSVANPAIKVASESFGTEIGKWGARAVLLWCLSHADTIQKLAHDLIALGRSLL